jgi:hypothetical protein
MATRALVEWPDRTYYTPALNVTRHERLRQIAGVTFFAIVLIGVCLLSGGPQ